jgi:hypothetical protein
MRTIKRIALIAALTVGIPWSMAPMAHAATIKDVEAAVTALQATVSAQAAQISALQAQVTALQNSNVMALNPYVSVDTTDTIQNATGLKGPHVLFTGVNVHIRSGSGSTADGTVANPDNSLTGLGNLIIGYNEPRIISYNNFDLTGRGGSHNLIVGPGHKYESYGGFVAGSFNEISGVSSSVSGGDNNTASGNYSSVSGGGRNTASGNGSSVSGGTDNTASGEDASSVSGGVRNTASGGFSSVSGGLSNTASGPYSSVSGGYGVTATDSEPFGWSAGGQNPNPLISPFPLQPPWFTGSDYLGMYHSP